MSCQGLTHLSYLRVIQIMKAALRQFSDVPANSLEGLQTPRRRSERPDRSCWVLCSETWQAQFLDVVREFLDYQQSVAGPHHQEQTIFGIRFALSIHGKKN